jgi:5-methylcytosine-specific restriction protein A
MSTKRRESAKHIRDPEGGFFCSCGCGRKPGKGRLYWHSAECVERWREINDPAYIRQQLKRRDKGICAACGCNSEAEFKAWKNAYHEAYRLHRRLETMEEWKVARAVATHNWQTACRELLWPDCVGKGHAFMRAKREKEILRLMGTAHREGWTAGRQTAWDADHIVEVVKGGGLCGLDNYQTLCHPCHKAKTARLARERAEARRAQQQGRDLFSSVPQNTTKSR